MNVSFSYVEGKGVVTSMKRVGDKNEYIIFDGERYHKVSTTKRIKRRSVRFTSNDIEELKEDIFKEVKNRFFRRISFRERLPEELEFLRKNMEKLWKELAFSKIVAEKPFVYFDPDADGIVSLLLISEVVRVNFRPLNPWHLENGTYLYPDLRAPYFIFLDLGSTPDLHPGVKFVGSLAETYVVDHHFTERAPPRAVLINPSTKDPSFSKYTTAFLVSLLVSTWVKKPDWVRVAVAGDRSDVIHWTKTDRRKALALEITPDVFGVNLTTFKQVLETDLWRSLWELFKTRIEKIEEIAEKEEKEINGMKILIVRYPSPGFHYPHRGKVASWYQEEGGYDVVIVEEIPKQKVFTISMRAKQDLFPLVNRIKTSGIGNGWGHPMAVTLKVEDVGEAEKMILGWLNEGSSESNRSENT